MIRWPFGRKDAEGMAPASSSRSSAPSPATGNEWIAEGRALVSQGRYDEAIAMLDGVVERQPLNLVALYDRANAAYTAGRFEDARAACERALERLPNQVDLLLLSGAIAASAHDPLRAIERFELARARRADLPGIDARIGEQLAFLGRGPESISAYDRAIANDPANFALGSSRLFLLNHFGLLDRERLAAEHRAWGQRLEASVAGRRRPHDNDRSPDRMLRVGIVSPDLRDHPVAFWLEGYLRAHDASRFELHAFDVSPYREDEVTRRLRQGFDAWHRVGALDDDAVAEAIRAERIDILVDLAGHTGHHRLAVFARKPAPVQASWFGYMNTSGLATIDWRITDAQHAPAGADVYFSERLWRIASIACFVPYSPSPEPGPLPAASRGYVTFASANNWAKVSELAKDAWARVLVAAPTARLQVIARGANDPDVAARVRESFSVRGVDTQRVDVLPFLPLPQFLASFREVDVALDPFPYGGGTTTLHSLWMGVPIVSLEGETELARATAQTMRGVGHPEFAARDLGEYERIAKALARHPASLEEVRAGLRERLRASAAMDYAGFARDIEAAFRGMWLAWIGRQAAEQISASPRV